MTNNSNSRKTTARELVAAKQVRALRRPRQGRRRPPLPSRTTDPIGRSIWMRSRRAASLDGLSSSTRVASTSPMTTVQRSTRPPSSPRSVTRLSSGGSGSTAPASHPTRSWAFCMTALSCRSVKASVTPTQRIGSRGSLASPKTRGSMLSCSCCKTRERLSCSPSPPAQRPVDVP